MGLDVTKANGLLKTIGEMQEEYRYYSEIRDRNCVVLPTNYKLANMFDSIDDNLCYVSGMVRFEYVDWHSVKRRVEGHVCSVTQNQYAAEVKILAESGEMVTIFLAAVNDVQLFVLPDDYTAKTQEITDDF